MNKPQFIRSNAPHIVEVAEGSHDARSNFGGERGPDGRCRDYGVLLPADTISDDIQEMSSRRKALRK